MSFGGIVCDPKMEFTLMNNGSNFNRNYIYGLSNDSGLKVKSFSKVSEKILISIIGSFGTYVDYLILY